MERFTTYKDGWRVLGDGAYMDDALSVRGEAIDRLAAYEDTGLTPEEFKESVDFVFELNKKLAAYQDMDAEPEEVADVLAFCKENGLKNLVGLLNAIATDRVIVLPCKPTLPEPPKEDKL